MTPFLARYRMRALGSAGLLDVRHNQVLLPVVADLDGLGPKRGRVEGCGFSVD